MTSDTWPRVALRYLSAIPITNGLGEAARDGDDSWPRYIRTTDITGLKSLDPGKRVTLPPEVARPALVKRGDILMTAAGSLGTSYLQQSDESACFAGYLVRWRVDRRRADPRFMAYWTVSRDHQDQVAVGAVRSTIDNFSASKFRAMHAPVPPLDEQRAIADFLDRETAQTDAMVDAQERLAKLLEERRKSALDHALAPAWKHDRVRLKHLLRVSAEYNSPDSEVLSVYREHGVIPKSSRTDNFNKTPENLDRYLKVRTADLVVNRMKAWQGSLGVSRYDGIVSPDYEVLRPIETALDPDFLHLIVRSPQMIGEYHARSTGIRPSQWRLYWQEMGNIEIPVPPLNEQREVPGRMHLEAKQTDAMIAKARESIALMKERRSALISAAVTGLIDVRTGIDQVERVLEEAGV